MNLKPVNFDDSELKEDLARLQTFCEHSGEEGWELFDESDIGLTTDFFKRYNRSFSFCLLQKLKYLFSQTELDFKPFVSNLKEFRLRHIYELYFFEKPMDVYISPIDTFNLVWENYGSVTDFEFEIHGPMKVDLKKSIEFMELKKQIPIDNFENFENLKKDLIILLGFYNVWLEFLLESLAARKTFLHIYTESNNFLFFQEKIFENILSLDQINHTLATDLLTFRKNYAELCRMMPKTE